MTNKDKHIIDSANSSDFQEVVVLFNDNSISQIFTNLLRANGVKASIISDLSEFKSDEKIITEQQFYKRLPEESKKNCLLLANSNKTKSEGVLLTQPLTEEKIENALNEFFGI